MDERAREWEERFDKVWSGEDYRRGSCGQRLVDYFLGFTGPIPEVNDYGSGTGRAAVDMSKRGIRVNCVDISTVAMEDPAKNLVSKGLITFTHAPLWELPESFPKVEWGFSADVLMTIPPEMLHKVLSEIRRTCSNCFFENFNWPHKYSGYDLTTSMLSADEWEKAFAQHWNYVYRHMVPGNDHRMIHVALDKVAK